MKAWIINNGKLDLIEKNKPTPGKNEVLVNWKSWSLNYRDLVVKRGEYGKSKTDLIPLSDAAGEVVQCGPEVSEFKVKDRVMSIFMPQWQKGAFSLDYAQSALGNFVDGTLAEFSVFSASSLIKIPDYLDTVSASTLPCAGLTAWNALVTAGKLEKGMKVLLIGTGGVSLFALQIAKIFGAEVFIISSQNNKLELAQKLGADHLINYKDTPEWSKRIWEITNKRGVDLIVETGGAQTINQSLNAASANACISLIGVLSGINCNISLPDIYRRMLNVKGIMVGSKENFTDFIKFSENHKIKPIISARYDFSLAPKAYEDFSKQTHFGKIIIHA